MGIKTAKIIRIIIISYSIGMLIFFIIKKYQHIEHIKELVKNEIGGVIISTEDLTRGDHSIIISQPDGSQYKLTHRVTHFLEENNIQINDSLYTSSNSKTIKFYKKTNHGFIYCCSHEINW